MIPRRPEEISTAWMTRALRESGALPEGRVTAIARIPDPSLRGYNGKLARFRLVLDRDVPGAPESIAAKFPPDSPTQLTQSGGLEAELRFYQELAPHAPILTPTCFFGGLDSGKRGWGRRTRFQLPDSTPASVLRALTTLARRVGMGGNGRYLLLLEDLSDRRFGDLQAGCGPEEAASVLRSLAALHARFWADNTLEKRRWIPDAFAFPDFLGDLYNRWLDARREALAQEPDERTRDIHIWLRSHASGVIRRLAAFPRTLVHGDLHFDNVYFCEEGIGLVDWQMVMKGVGALDVAGFVMWSVNATPGEVGSLVRGYHRELVAQGVRGFSFDHCYQAFQLAVVFHYLLGCLKGAQAAARDDQFKESASILGARARVVFPENPHELLRP